MIEYGHAAQHKSPGLVFDTVRTISESCPNLHIFPTNKLRMAGVFNSYGQWKWDFKTRRMMLKYKKCTNMYTPESTWFEIV